MSEQTGISWGQRERSLWHEENLIEGTKRTLPCFTCTHCGSVVVMHPERSRPRNVCRKCDALTCEQPGCLAECNPIHRDEERAFERDDGQPYLHRADASWGASHVGEPVDIIWVPGEVGPRTVLRSQNGMTEREVARQTQCVHRWYKVQGGFACIRCSEETDGRPDRRQIIG